MERQRDKRLKAPGIILHSTQAKHMVDAILVVLDMPVQHGSVRAQTELMRGARGLQPFVAVNLVNRR